MSRIIELKPYGRGHFATVDEDEYDFLSRYTWHYRKGYAVFLYRWHYKQHSIPMHRYVNQTPRRLFTDHINGNKLDNRRENLRTVDLVQSAWNIGPKHYSTSGYQGVVWWPRDRKWKAGLRVNHKHLNLGYFETAEEAAAVFNHFAKQVRGEYARLNVIPEDRMSLEDQKSFVSSWLRRRHIRGNNTSGYRGVRWNKSQSKWISEIKTGGKRMRIGTYIHKEAAARAYNEAAINAFGHKARLNPV